MVDIFTEMTAKDVFIDLVAQGVPAVNAGIQVSWSPARTKAMLRDPEFADIVAGALSRANASIEEALYAKALAGNVSAMQMWLFNREPDRWRDVKRIEVRSDTRVSITAVESVKAGVLELLREQGVGAMQALDSGIIYDAETDAVDD